MAVQTRHCTCAAAEDDNMCVYHQLVTYLASTMFRVGHRLFRGARAQSALITFKKCLGALELRGRNFFTWKVVRRSNTTIAVATGMKVTEIKEHGDWKSDAYTVYVARDEVDRLQHFGKEVDDSSSEEDDN